MTPDQDLRHNNTSTQNAKDSAPTATCSNCDTMLQGAFCHQCGQNKESGPRLLLDMLSAWAESLFSYNSKVKLTLVPLLLKPGAVALEYIGGKRARHIPPFRLYLFCSVSFFLINSLFSTSHIEQSSPKQQESTPIIVEQIEPLPSSDSDSATPPIAPSLNDQVISQPSNANSQEPDNSEDNDDVAIDIKGLNTVMESLGLPDSLKEHISIQTEKLAGLSNDQILSLIYNSLPKAMFLLIPFFALVLKGLYFFRHRLYVEHLIVGLYSHSFIFLTLTIGKLTEASARGLTVLFPVEAINATSEPLTTILLLWIPTYLILMQKRVYPDRWRTTILKFCLISFSYLIMLSIAMATAVVWSWLTL